MYLVVNQLQVKKRRPINKKEAKRFNKMLESAHNIHFSLSAGKYETAISKDFDIILDKGFIFGLILEDTAHLSVRGLLSNLPEIGWVQVDMGAVPFVWIKLVPQMIGYPNIILILTIQLLHLSKLVEKGVEATFGILKEEVFTCQQCLPIINYYRQ